MKQAAQTQFTLWRSEHLFNIDFATYTLSNHHFARHFHDHFVIELVLSGEDSFFCNGENYLAHSGQLVLINPGEIHTGNTVGDNQLEYFSLYPDRCTLETIANLLHLQLPGQLEFRATLIDESLLTHKFSMLCAALRANENPLRLQEIFFDCMYHLLQHSGAGQNIVREDNVIGGTDSRVSILTQYIHDNCTSELSLDKIAEQVNLNPFHGLRLFKRKIGLTPYEYLLICRTEYAKQLLRSGHKVQDAALEAGFYDASHFNRSFRKLAGISPKSFLLSKGQYRTSSLG